MLEDFAACEEGSDLDQALEKISQKEHAKFVFSVGEIDSKHIVTEDFVILFLCGNADDESQEQ
jgi:predicted transcriptional regulator